MQLSLFDIEERIETVENSTALIIDGNNLLNRAYYSTALNPNNLMKAPDGRYTNGVFMFLRMMLRYKTELGITHLAVTFDKGRGFREKMYDGYKGTRGEQPLELKEQFPLLNHVLQEINVSVYSSEEFEADDLIASLAKKLEPSMKVYILSNDADLLQIVSNNIIQICRKGKEDVFFDDVEFRKQHENLSPDQVRDLKGLMGDTSDNIPGIPGVGEKGAYKILKTFGTIENLYENLSNLPKDLSRYQKKIVAGKETGILSKKLATLVTNIQVLEDQDEIQSKISRLGLLNVCKELGLYSLQKEIHDEKYHI